MSRSMLLLAAISLPALVLGCVPPQESTSHTPTYVAPKTAPERVPQPVKLSPRQMRYILQAARGPYPGPPRPAVPWPRKGMTVIVSIYARDVRGRAIRPFPALGQSKAEGDMGSDSLRAALSAWKQLAGRKCDPNRSAFKVDVVGKLGPVRQGLPAIQPGVDGLVLASLRGGEVFVPGSLYHADSPSLERYLRLAAAAAGLKTPRPRMHRTFTATSFANLSPGAEPLALYRGNALLARPGARALRSGVALAGKWLVGAQRPDGRFWYRYYPTERRYQKDRYNLARHCGSAWGLYILYDRTGRRDRKLLAAADRGLDWARSLARDPKSKKLRLPQYGPPGPTASGVGLVLLALVEGCRVSGRKELKAEAIALGDLTVKAFQHKSGRFWSWWNPRTGRPDGELSMVYHPGELILALAGLYEVTGRKRFLEAALRGMAAQVRAEGALAKAKKPLPPDAWTIMAVEALERVAPPRPAWRAHAWLLADSLMKGQYGSPTGPKPKAPDYLGGMNNLDPPIACAAGARGEGIAAACRLALKAGEAGRAALYRKGLIDAARFALEAQYRPENSFWMPEPARALGGVRQSLLDTTVRIDYVQHCALAMLAAAELLETEAAK